jgi:hypothetical protein
MGRVAGKSVITAPCRCLLDMLAAADYLRATYRKSPGGGETGSTCYEVTPKYFEAQEDALKNGSRVLKEKVIKQGGTLAGGLGQSLCCDAPPWSRGCPHRVPRGQARRCRRKNRACVGAVPRPGLGPQSRGHRGLGRGRARAHFGHLPRVAVRPRGIPGTLGGVQTRRVAGPRRGGPRPEDQRANRVPRVFNRSSIPATCLSPTLGNRLSFIPFTPIF